MENLSLKEQIASKEKELLELRMKLNEIERKSQINDEKTSLNHDEIARYSRQLILPELGVKGQILLSKSKVLIVGCGGLGCPSAVYLAAAGVGTLGLLDYDEVEISNLHRQVLHNEARVGMSKSESIASSVQSLNSHVSVNMHKVVLNSTTALDIVKLYDIVLDCTDNVATRYLLNDSCILTNKPLVSGAALRWEGQLTVYNYLSGPCYRCLFPSPPPPETVTNCSDGGVMGVVPGIIGSMQALEAVKIIAKIGDPLSGFMLVFDAFSSTFRKIKLRGRQSKCVVCGDDPTVTKLIDYEQFCGAKAEDKDASLNLLNGTQRISVEEYRKMTEEATPHLLIDVRQPVELGICSLPNTLNIPIKELTTDDNIVKIQEAIADRKAKTVVCVCRRGNDSQRAVQNLAENIKDCEIKDIVGGLTAWAKKIDNSMPIY